MPGSGKGARNERRNIQIVACRAVGKIIPSPGGKGDREAVDEERRPLQITEPSHFFGIRPNVVP